MKGDSVRAKLEFLRDMARELAVMSEVDGLELLAYLFRMAEAEAGRLGLSPLIASAGENKKPARTAAAS